MKKVVYRLKQATITVDRLNEPDVPTGKHLARLLADFNKAKEMAVKYPRESPKWADLQYKMRHLREAMGHVREKRVKKPVPQDPSKKDGMLKSGVALSPKFKVPSPSQSKYVLYSVLIELNHWSKFKKTYTMELHDDGFTMDGVRRQISAYKKHAIQRQRLEAKYNPYHEILIDGHSAVFTGNRKTKRVFMKEGQILKAYIKRNLKSLFEDKKPTNKSNYLGVEIEFCAPVTEDMLALKLFHGGFHKFVQLKQDGSLRPQKGETGFELAMLLRESSYKKDLKSVCDLIESLKGTATDRRCGLHVHFDMRKRDKDVVFNNLVSCQNVLWSLVDPRRYDNEFCRNVNSKKFPTRFNNTREERYKTINAAAYYRHKTLEVRMHEGTVAFKDMSNWIDVLLKIVNYDKKMKYDIAELQTLKKRVRLNNKVYKAVVDKTCFWQVNQADHVARAAQAQDALARETLFQMEQAELNRTLNAIGGDRGVQVQVRTGREAERITNDGVFGGAQEFRQAFFAEPVATNTAIGTMPINDTTQGAADPERPEMFEDDIDNDTDDDVF